MQRDPKQAYIKRQSPNQVTIEKSIKVNTIAYIQGKVPENRKISILEIHPNQKLLYHCYKRFKSFPYSLDYVYDQNCDTPFISNPTHQSPNPEENSYGLTRYEIIRVFDKGLNYVLYCHGIKLQSNQSLSRQIQIFYDLVSPLFDQKQGKTFSFNLYCFAVNQDIIFDLNSDKPIKEIREIPSKQFSSPLNFSNASPINIETEYQLYALIQKTHSKKRKLYINSYYIVYCEINTKYDQQGGYKEDNNTILFIDAVKEYTDTKMWDKNTQLVLNKCLIGLINKMGSNSPVFDKGSKQSSYSPFRDSKVTRILKPFITQNSKTSIIGFVDRNDQENTYQTLSLVKNMGKVRVPVTVPQEATNYSRVQQSHVKKRAKTEQNPPQQSKHHNYSKELLTIDESEHKLKIQEKKSEMLIKILRNKLMNQRIMRLPQINNNSNSQQRQLIVLEQKQLQYKEEKLQIMKKNEENLKEERRKMIESTSTKTDKLKLMKDYYLRNLEYQKQEIEKTLEYERQLTKVYKNSIKTIQDELKKSPKQLLSYEHSPQQPSVRPSAHSRNKRYSHNKQQTIQISHTKVQRFRQASTDNHNIASEKQKRKLPHISYHTRDSKRQELLRNKVRKGRVQYSSFLSKNVEEYQSYVSPKHK